MKWKESLSETLVQLNKRYGIMKKKCVYLLLIICVMMGLFLLCPYHYIKIGDHQTIRVEQLYGGGMWFDYPSQFGNEGKFEGWLKYSEKQHYSLFCELFRFSFHRISFVIQINPKLRNPDAQFHFSEYENKVFYYRSGFWEYSRDMTDVDREFLKVLNRCFDALKNK